MGPPSKAGKVTLLAIDLGLCFGWASYASSGKLSRYGSRHFGNRTALRKAVPGFLKGYPDLKTLVIEGGGDLKRPYILGNRRVVPRVNTTYPLNSTLTLYYQVYNATEEGGAPNLRISYNIYRKRGSTYRKEGTAANAVKDAAVIYELSLKGWPKGEYKIKVTVTDTFNESFAQREIPFQVG